MTLKLNPGCERYLQVGNWHYINKDPNSNSEEQVSNMYTVKTLQTIPTASSSSLLSICMLGMLFTIIYQNLAKYAASISR